RLAGRFGEAGLDPRPANHLVGSRRQIPGRQTQGLVQGTVPPAAVPAVIVVALEAERPEQAERRPAAQALAARVPPAVRAAQAGALVPPFFRSGRAACKVAAPRRCRDSRRSNSVLPSRWALSLLARSSARRRAPWRKGPCRRWKRRSASACWVRFMGDSCGGDFGRPGHDPAAYPIFHPLSKCSPLNRSAGAWP